MSALTKPTLRLLDTHSLGVVAGWVGRAITPFLRLQSDYGLTIRDSTLNIHPPQWTVGETRKRRLLRIPCRRRRPDMCRAARLLVAGRRSLPGWRLFISGGGDEHELSAGRQLQRGGDAVDANAFGFARRPRAARAPGGGERATTRPGATLFRVLGLLALWLSTYGPFATGSIRRGDRAHSAIAKGAEFRDGECYSRVAQLRVLRLQYQCAGTSVLPAGARLRSQVVEPARGITQACLQSAPAATGAPLGLRTSQQRGMMATVSQADK
jgi:hypothetical protein